MIATKRTFGMLSALVLVMLVHVTMTTAQRNNSPEALMQRATQKEMVDGDLKAALDLYKKVADTRGVAPALAAEALIGMGRAYESLGNGEAQKVYERVIQDYAGQAAVATAQARLKALGSARSTAAIVPKGLTLISSPGNWSALSPDNRYLLNARGNMYDLATGQELQIPMPEDCRAFMSFAVSADGKQLAYVCSIGPRRGFELRTASLSGPKGAAAKVLLHTDTNTYFETFGWSRDGKEVLAIVEREHDATVIGAVSAASGSLRIIKPLDFFQFPRKMSVSPDGRYIAYDAPETKDSPSNKDIFVLATDGSSQVAIVQTPATDIKPVWTPDSKAVVFMSDRSGTWGLWKIQIAAGKPQGAAESLRRNTGELDPIGFASDGSFYYSAPGGGITDIYTAEIDLEAGTITRTAARAVEQSHGSNASPAYSPDGKSLAYLRRTSAGVSIVIRVLGSEVEQEIPKIFTSLQSPISWFPDGGRSLLFGAYSPYDGFNLRRLDLRTGEDLMERKISSTDAGVSPDGKTIYYFVEVENKNADIGQEYRLIASQLETQRETELFRGTIARGSGQPLAVSPDGQQIVFRLLDRLPAKPDATAANAVLAIVPTAGGVVRKLRSPETPRWRLIQWSSDGRKILAQKANGELWWIPVDGGEPERIGNVTFPAIESLHPDGKHIAITRQEGTSPRQHWVDPDLLRSRTNARRDNR